MRSVTHYIVVHVVHKIEIIFCTFFEFYQLRSLRNGPQALHPNRASIYTTSETLTCTPGVCLNGLVCISQTMHFSRILKNQTQQVQSMPNPVIAVTIHGKLGKLSCRSTRNTLRNVVVDPTDEPLSNNFEHSWTIFTLNRTFDNPWASYGLPNEVMTFAGTARYSNILSPNVWLNTRFSVCPNSHV